MATPIYICGAECAIAAVGTASAGVEHWTSVGGAAPSISTTTINPRGLGARSFRFNPSATNSVISHTFATAIASPATMVTRFYLYFATLPNADVILFISGASTGGLAFKQSDSTLRACGSAPNVAASGKVITTGVWYRIDLKVVRNATITVDLSVDGVAQAQYSVGGAASTFTSFSLGPGTCTCDMFVDDLVVSGTSGDFPLGGGGVCGLYPNADGAHAYNAANDFGKGSGGGTDLNATSSLETTVWQSLSNPLSTSIATNFVSARNCAVGEEVAFTFADMPSGVGVILGAMIVCTTHSASTTANNFTLRFGSVDLINADLSESTITVPCLIRNTDSGGTPWTLSTINGNSTVSLRSSDVTPDVYLDGVCWEVAWLGERPDAGLASGTGAANNATSAQTAAAGNAAGTGAANNAVAGHGALAGLASGTGTAYNASVAIGVPVPVAVATGQAYDATASIVLPHTDANAGLASGTGAAYDATTGLTAGAGSASGSGSAQTAAGALGVLAGVATGTGQAYDASVAIGVAVPVATAVGAAQAAQAALTVPAQTAAGSGQALDAQGGVGALASVATATGAAAPASVGVGTNVDPATGTGSSGITTGALTANVDPAAGTGTAYDATVSTTEAGVEADVEVATGSGQAYNASVAIGVAVPVAVATGAATPASIQATVSVEPATGTGQALPAQGGAGALAGAAQGSGTAFGVLGGLAALAGAAAGAGAAWGASPAFGVYVDPATGAGGAAGLQVWVAPNVEPATGTGEAFDATVIAISAGAVFVPVATGVGTAYDATVLIRRPGGAVWVTAKTDRVRVGHDNDDSLAVSAEVASVSVSHRRGQQVAVSSDQDNLTVWEG